MSLNKVQLKVIWKGQGHHRADALPASIQTHRQTLTKKTSHTFPLLPLEPQKLISALCRPKALLSRHLLLILILFLHCISLLISPLKPTRL